MPRLPDTLTHDQREHLKLAHVWLAGRAPKNRSEALEIEDLADRAISHVLRPRLGTEAICPACYPQRMVNMAHLTPDAVRSDIAGLQDGALRRGVRLLERTSVLASQRVRTAIRLVWEELEARDARA